MAVFQTCPTHKIIIIIISSSIIIIIIIIIIIQAVSTPIIYCYIQVKV